MPRQPGSGARASGSVRPTAIDPVDLVLYVSACSRYPYRLQIGAGGLHIERWSAEGHHASTEAEARWTGARS